MGRPTAVTDRYFKACNGKFKCKFLCIIIDILFYTIHQPINIKIRFKVHVLSSLSIFQKGKTEDREHYQPCETFGKPHKFEKKFFRGYFFFTLLLFYRWPNIRHVLYAYKLFNLFQVMISTDTFGTGTRLLATVYGVQCSSVVKFFLLTVFSLETQLLYCLIAYPSWNKVDLVWFFILKGKKSSWKFQINMLAEVKFSLWHLP
jgi:hypothetical protein